MTTEEISAVLKNLKLNISADKVIVVDPETRTMTIPESVERLGTQSDEKTERKYFICPKIVGDDFDLSVAKIYVNYQNASGSIDGKDRHPVNDVQVSGDYIFFSWVLDRKVTLYNGTVRFSMCATSADTGDKREWNTTIAEGKVLEGLELVTAEEQETRGSEYIQILTSDATAVAGNIEQGKTAYIAGERVEGTLPVNDTMTVTSGTVSYATAKILGSDYPIFRIASAFEPKNDAKKMIFDGKRTLEANALGYQFGDAKPEHVLKGKTFSSNNGLKVTGTMEPFEGKHGASGIVTGKGTNLVVIDTGLDSVDIFVLYYASFPATNRLLFVFKNFETDEEFNFGASPGSYMTSLVNNTANNLGELSVSGGTVTYNPGSNSFAGLASGATYNWIAVGQ